MNGPYIMPPLSADYTSFSVPGISYDYDAIAAQREKAEAERKAEEEAQRLKNVKAANNAIALNTKAIAELDKQLPKVNQKPLTVWEKIGNGFIGLAKNITNLGTNEKGEFSPGRLALSIGIGAAYAACEIFITHGALTTALAPYLLAGGIISGVTQTAKGGFEAANAKTREEEIKAYQDLGEGIGAGALSIAGTGALKAMTKAAGLAKVETVTAEIGNLGKLKDLENIKNILSALRDSKGKSSTIKTALKDLDTVLETLGKRQNLTKAESTALKNLKNILADEKIASNSLKIFNKEQFMPQLRSIARSVTKKKDLEILNPIIESLNKVATKKDALEIIQGARNSLNGTSNLRMADFNTILGQIERNIQTPANAFGALTLPAKGSAVNGLGKVGTAFTKAPLPTAAGVTTVNNLISNISEDIYIAEQKAKTANALTKKNELAQSLSKDLDTLAVNSNIKTDKSKTEFDLLTELLEVDDAATQESVKNILKAGFGIDTTGKNTSEIKEILKDLKAKALEAAAEEMAAV